MSPKPVNIFLDREGVITPRLKAKEYLLTEEQAVVETGVAEALLKFVAQGCNLFIVSNQSCVSRGLIELEKAWTLHRKILNSLSAQGVTIKDSRLCPHVNEDGCACRKPKPGMILELCREHNLRPEDSMMIGDSARDVEAGQAAGCPVNVLLADGPSPLTEHVYRDLKAAADALIENNIV